MMFLFFDKPVAFALVSVSLWACVGCGKSEETNGASGSAPSAKSSASVTSAATAAPGAAAAAAAPGGAGKVLAQCMNKGSATCKESYRSLAAAAEDFCKGLDGSGVFTKGETPCPKDNLVATCEFAGQEQTELTYHYRDKSMPLAQQLEGAKTACGFVDGKFAEVPQAPETKAAGGKPAAAAKAPAKKK